MPSPRETLKVFSAILVTGGSSGIGKSFIELGFTVKPDILICNLSRRRPVINFPELKLRHFPCDLEDSGAVERIWPELAACVLREAPEGRILLINNSGFGGYGGFPEPDLKRQLAMIDVNVRALVQLTGRMLPLLKTRGGVVITVASTAAFQPTPWLATYGATKAFVLHWTLALNEELRGTGVRAIAVCPGPTETEFHARAGLRKGAVPAGMSQTAAEVAEAAFRALGARRSQVVTGWTNRLGVCVSSLVPKPCAARLAGRILGRYRKA